MPLYRKLPTPVGFARSADVFPAGTRMTVRTLEGDLDVQAGGDVFLMIGVAGEVYPIKRARFHESYAETGEPYNERREYEPSVISRADGSRRPIGEFARCCRPRESKLIRARELKKDTKIFTSWDTGGHFLAAAGSFLAANEGDYADCYGLRRDIFFRSYEPC
jgi:phosphoglycolate phosphatase